MIFDPEKDRSNLAKHGISLAAALDFDWHHALVRADTRQTYGEDRYQAIGYIEDRLYVAVFTYRADTLRMISLRKANAREVRDYDDEKTN